MPMLTALRGVARAGIPFSSLWVDSSWFLRYTHLYSYIGWYVFEGDQGNYRKSLRCMYSETTHWGIHHCHGLLGVCIRVFCRTCRCWYISMVFKHFPTNKLKNKKVRIYKTRALEFYICVLMRRNYVFVYKNVVQTCTLYKHSWDKLYLCSSIITDPGFITIW